MAILYKEIKGEKHTWYVPMITDPNKELYVSYHHDKGGHGGENITFNLVNGLTKKVKGPYHCFHHFYEMSFYVDTNRHLNDVVIEYFLLEKEQ